MHNADFGVIIALISVITGVGILLSAAAGVYFLGKNRAQKEALRSADPELLARLARVEQIVEATAVEIERISEGQRFTTRLLTDTKSESKVL